MDDFQRDQDPARPLLAQQGEQGLLRRVLTGRAASVSRVQLHAGSSGPRVTRASLFGVSEYEDLPDRDRAIARAAEIDAFLEGVPYARYDRKHRHGQRS